MKDVVTAPCDGVISATGLRSRNESIDWFIAEELPLAIFINSKSYAVMLATPINMEDFAVGFCISENLVRSFQDILSIRIKRRSEGFELHVDLTNESLERFRLIERRRTSTSASGCGLCGLSSFDQVLGNLKPLETTVKIASDVIEKSCTKLRDFTPLNNASRSIHGAVFFNKAGVAICAREDIGRHNALDKLIGALARENNSHIEGFVVLTSRLAFELAQKCIRAGIQIAVSFSAPSNMALDIAKTGRLTLAVRDKDGSLVVFTNTSRISMPAIQSE